MFADFHPSIAFQTSSRSITMNERIITAFAGTSFPINPIPFSNAISDFVRENGTNSIQSDEAKAILWVLIAMAYGQMASIDLSDEWNRLSSILCKEELSQ